MELRLIMKITKLKDKLSPLVLTSFSFWFLCVLAFVGIFILIENKTATQISNTHILMLVLAVVMGVISFSVGLIAITYKLQGKNITKNNPISACIKAALILTILPIFLLWNILQPIELFRKLKSLGIRQYWKEFKFKTFALKSGAFFVSFIIILPMWIGGYIATAWFVGTRTGQMISPIMVSGGSMYPTFPKGDDENSEKITLPTRTITYPSGIEFMGQKFFSYEIKRGDIVVFSNDMVKELSKEDTSYIKRVVALPGDTIEIRDRIFYLNNIPQKEPYIAEPRSTLGSQFFSECQPITIPEGKIFVMGDNRKASQDSRSKLGVIDYDDILNVIPLEKQHGKLDKNWRDTTHDLDNSSLVVLDTNKYTNLVNEKRKEVGLPPLKYQSRLEQSAKLRGDVILKYADFSFDADKSGYGMKKAMRDAGYSNIVYGELPTQGYYSSEELIENQFEFPESKEFILSKEYQDIGVAVVRGEMNGCPTQVIIQHLAGYSPPNYKQSDIDSWRSTVSDLKKIKPGWEDLKKYDIYYKEHKKDINRINSIISERISNARMILSKMETNQWLSAEEQGLIDRDATLFREQNKLADKLND
ncbi:MAG: signal peptidase I [Candidatus Moraniibacteriota bacterium]